MDITTINRDRGQKSPEFVRNQSRVKFEVLSYNPYEVKPKKAGFFSSFLRVLGGFAPLAYVAAPFTGGASLIAATAFSSAGIMGTMSQSRQLTEQARGNQQPPVMAYPGLNTGGLINPASLASDPTLDLVVGARDNATYSSIREIK